MMLRPDLAAGAAATQMFLVRRGLILLALLVLGLVLGIVVCVATRSFSELPRELLQGCCGGLDTVSIGLIFQVRKEPTHVTGTSHFALGEKS